MKVAELGEFGLIALLASIVEKRGVKAVDAEDKTRTQLEIGIGDDAAAWCTEAAYQLATTDTLVQGVHFTLETASWYELGWKSLAVNISDIAAMGGVPRYALITLALPLDTEVEDIEKLYEGMLDISQQYGVIIAGGDIVRAPITVISVALWGLALEEDGRLAILRRAGAVPGDVIAVTGHLGTSAAGLLMLKDKLEFDEVTRSLLRQAHLRPQPRVKEGQLLVERGITSAMDISDGLVDDLGKLCQASGVGARIWQDRVPVHPAVRTSFPQDYLRLALAGGEDYELLFTGKRDIVEGIQRLANADISIIGEIVQDHVGQVMILDKEGRELKVERGGWDHFLVSGT